MCMLMPYALVTPLSSAWWWSSLDFFGDVKQCLQDRSHRVYAFGGNLMLSVEAEERGGNSELMDGLYEVT